MLTKGLLMWHNGKESVCQCRRCKRHRFDPWVRRAPWSWKWQPTPVYLSKKSYGQRNLACYNTRGHKELDVTALQRIQRDAKLTSYPEEANLEV